MKKVEKTMTYVPSRKWVYSNDPFIYFVDLLKRKREMNK